jgi:hypothetical protein
MRILLVTQYFYPEVFKSNDLAFELVKRGHQVDALVGIPNYPEGKYFKGYGIFKKRHEVVNGVNVYRVFQTPRGKGGWRLPINYFSFVILGCLRVLFQFAWKKKYDCIICNPPYFDESLESKDESRTRARHTSSLPFRDLIGGAYELLEDEGVFSVCIPPEVLSKFSAECLIKGFCLMTAYKIKSVPRKTEPKRYILVYKKGRIVEPQEYTFCMQNPDGTRSEWYQEIMKDFYL